MKGFLCWRVGDVFTSKYAARLINTGGDCRPRSWDILTVRAIPLESQVHTLMYPTYARPKKAKGCLNGGHWRQRAAWPTTHPHKARNQAASTLGARRPERSLSACRRSVTFRCQLFANLFRIPVHPGVHRAPTRLPSNVDLGQTNSDGLRAGRIRVEPIE